jgi:hypothetical protein
VEAYAESILDWFRSTNFFDYWNWLLSQPSSDTTAILIVGGVLLVSVIIVVVMAK